MSQSRRSRHKQLKLSQQVEAPPNFRKSLFIVLTIALTASGVVGIIASQEDAPTPILYPQKVELYRTHGCRCVFTWAKSLRKQGFRVRVYELGTLDNLRSRLHAPAKFNACHVGVYMGYFLEGHVSAAALNQLTKEGTAGIGLATENAVDNVRQVSVPEDEASDVLVIELGGRVRRWYSASGQRSDG